MSANQFHHGEPVVRHLLHDFIINDQDHRLSSKLSGAAGETNDKYAMPIAPLPYIGLPLQGH